MQFNFFTWIREGIKHAILLGVSDAVETLGTPMNGDVLNERLTEALQPAMVTAATSGRSGGTSKRKRLGRSLKDIDTKND